MPKAPEQYLQEPYSRILTPNGDGSYSAEILEFVGCFAEGDSPNEAIANLEKTALSWIAANLSHGHVIPEPFDNQDYAGRVALRLPRSYHRQASKMAERDGISLNQFLVNAIGEKIGAENLFSGLMRKFERKLTTRVSVMVIKQQSVSTAALETGVSTEHLSSIHLQPEFIRFATSMELNHG